MLQLSDKATEELLESLESLAKKRNCSELNARSQPENILSLFSRVVPLSNQGTTDQNDSIIPIASSERARLSSRRTFRQRVSDRVYFHRKYLTDNDLYSRGEWRAAGRPSYSLLRRVTPIRSISFIRIAFSR